MGAKANKINSRTNSYLNRQRILCSSQARVGQRKSGKQPKSGPNSVLALIQSRKDPAHAHQTKQLYNAWDRTVNLNLGNLIVKRECLMAGDFQQIFFSAIRVTLVRPDWPLPR